MASNMSDVKGSDPLEGEKSEVEVVVNADANKSRIDEQMSQSDSGQDQHTRLEEGTSAAAVAHGGETPSEDTKQDVDAPSDTQSDAKPISEEASEDNNATSETSQGEASEPAKMDETADFSEVHRGSKTGEILVVEDLGLSQKLDSTPEGDGKGSDHLMTTHLEEKSANEERSMKSDRQRPASARSPTRHQRPASGRPASAGRKKPQAFYSDGPGGKLHKHTSLDGLKAWESWKESSDKKLEAQRAKRVEAAKRAKEKKEREAEAKKQSEEAFQAWKEKKERDLAVAEKQRKEAEAAKKQEIERMMSLRQSQRMDTRPKTAKKRPDGPSASELLKVEMEKQKEMQRRRQIESEAAIEAWKERKRETKRIEMQSQRALQRKHVEEARQINARMDRIRLQPSRQ